MAKKSLTFKIDGLDDILKGVTSLSNESMNRMEDASYRGSTAILYKALAKVPERTGKLAENLKVSSAKWDKKQKFKVTSNVWFSDDTKYGIYLELGHKLIRNGNQIGTVKERPFLRPAADESRTKVRNIMTDALNDVLKNYGGE